MQAILVAIKVAVLGLFRATVAIVARVRIVGANSQKARPSESSTIEAVPTVSAQSEPRVLPTNPFSGPKAPETIGSKIESAAAASVEFGKTLGLIYFDVGVQRLASATHGAAADTRDFDRLLTAFRAVLRTTDHVELVDGHEIVVCIPLLPGPRELKSISERIREIGQRCFPSEPAFEVEPGTSIYGFSGWKGDELIQSARRTFLASRYSTGVETSGPAGAGILAPRKSARKA